MAEYYTLLTNDGIAYENDRKAKGLPIKLTKMSVGDGNGAVYNPDATAKALKREVWRGDINSILQDAENPSWLVLELTLPDDVGGFYVREAGVWTDTGILYAVLKYPESYKPILSSSGSGKEFYLKAIFQTSNAANVVIQVDESIVKATRTWVIDYVAQELSKLDNKQSVRVATTANITLSGTQTIDGIVLVVGDRVLVKNQTTGSQNGIWVVATGAWARAADANISAEVTPQLTVGVEQGTVNGDSFWFLQTDAPITLGTTALSFQQIYTAPQVAALLAAKAPLASPTFTGTPKAPTAAAGTDSDQIATMTALLQGMAAFGIGTQIAPLVTDLNAITKGGIYRANSDAANLPFATSCGILHVPYSSTAAVQIVGCFSSTTNARLYWRGCSSSAAWSDWREVAKLDSPTFTGTPVVPTAAAGTNSDQAASTKFVQTAIAQLVNQAPETLNQFNEIAAALGNDPNFATTMMQQLGLKAPLASPALSGTPTAPTPAVGTNSPQIATMAALLQGMAAFGIGTEIMPLVSDLNAITKGGIYRANNDAANLPFATSCGILHLPYSSTAAVQIVGCFSSTANARLFWRGSSSSTWSDWREVGKLDSPALAGVPTAPTPAVGTNTDQVATMKAIVQALAAFGIGTNTTSIVADCDALTVSGLYACSTGGTANIPYNNNGFIIHTPWNGSSAMLQIYVAASANVIKWRTKSQGSWREWNDFALLSSPSFTGTPTAPTADRLDSSKTLATTEFVWKLLQSYGIGTVDLNDQASGIDLDTVRAGGVYQVNAIVNGPGALTSGVLWVATNSTYWTHQLFMPQGTLRLYQRCSAGQAAGFGGWREIGGLDSPIFTGTPTAPTPPAGDSSKKLATTEFVASLVASRDVGMSFMHAGSTPPPGSLKENGAAVSRTTYAALFAVIGTTYGAGDGSTTFNLPESRGEFIRALDDGRGIDTGRTIGSSQAGQNAAHTHTGTTSTNGAHSHTTTLTRERILSNYTPTDGNAVIGDQESDGTQPIVSDVQGSHSHTFTTSSSGGTEARPRNVARLACIRYM